ncbi:MAG: DUF1614 domain-containing protein [Burkholderiaceae bacterium]
MPPWNRDARGRGPLWLLVGALLAWLQFDAMRAAFERLGLSPAGALGLLAGCAIGSGVDLPVARLRGSGTLVMLNVGGCVIPVAMAGWVVAHVRLGAVEVLLATAGVALASWRFSRVEPGVGVTMRGFVAPLAALACGALVDPQALAPLAYVAGTLGVLVGADLMRLREAASSGAAALSMGGAGTRDGIFMAGVVAVLFA